MFKQTKEEVGRGIDWQQLSTIAWLARDAAFVIGNTKVGSAALCEDGRIFAGCNVEHRYRSHDVHAEVNAISTMVAGGGRRLTAVLVAAERELFTPCGACMDWIFQFGGPECLVAFHGRRDADPIVHSAEELMPHYPR